MSYENNGVRKVRPAHPGEMLREDFLPEYELTVSAFVKALGVSRQSANDLLRERRAVSTEMALRLARLFGNTPEFWLNAQRAVDLWETAKTSKKAVTKIRPLTAAYAEKMYQGFCVISSLEGNVQLVGVVRPSTL